MSQSASRRPHLADAADIEQWAERVMARSDLARLIRSLVRETNDQVTTLEMRGGEGSEVPGYDGIVEAGKGAPFVPEGRSVWEFGTGEVPTDKATDDYRKRTDDPLGEDQANTTFVFVTPRRWPGKQAWINARTPKSPWKAIKVFDVDDIETALDQAAGTHHIFSDQIGKPAFGVQALEEWWKRFSASTSPRLTNAMVLAGREDQARDLLQVLAQDIARTTLVAASTDDLLAFVAGAISSAAEELRADLFARALLIRDVVALRALDRTAKFLILLPYEEALYREAQLILNHHVVLLAPAGMPGTVINGIDQERFAALLKEAGVQDDRAHALSLAAARSLVAFQHEAAALGAVLRPQWTAWFRNPVLRRGWLAGGWVELRTGDADVMADLLGQTLEASSESLREAASGEDPIFTSVASVWGVASPEAGWDYIRAYLTHADLAGLERAVQEVLGAIDPKLALAIDQRWQAAIHGKSRVHSENLRKGLATTLALLGALGESVQLGGGNTAQTWAERIIGQLLDRANADASGQLWTSISDLLPLLAEAAPAQFLKAVHKGMEGADPVIAKLFTDQQGDVLTTGSAHPSLLWALESLARSPEYFGLAMDALARLVELDPGGRLGNRADGTFVSVISPPFPQTEAAPAARLSALASLRTKHPDKAWPLTMGALPGHMWGGTYNHRPRFGPWGPTSSQVSQQEYQVMVEGIVDELLRMVDDAPNRWPELIERIPDMPASKRAEVYRRLRELADG